MCVDTGTTCEEMLVSGVGLDVVVEVAIAWEGFLKGVKGYEEKNFRENLDCSLDVPLLGTRRTFIEMRTV